MHHYESDIEPSIVDEAIHLCAILQNEKPIDKITDLADYIFKNKLVIAFRIFLCTLATNCSAERSFSCLKRVKNYLRSTLSQERLNRFAILPIEKDLTKSLDCDHLIDLFAEKKSRSKPL